MISKQSAEVLLKILAQAQVSPMSKDADMTYRALAQARDELIKVITEEPKEVKE
jgi:hypothetical protein